MTVNVMIDENGIICGFGGLTSTLDDAVNHPKHYTSHPGKIECIQVTEHLNFCIGNAIKYLWRAGLKENNSDIQDLKKAVWYIEREIARLGGDNDQQSTV